jgi:hypothetical protein
MSRTPSRALFRSSAPPGSALITVPGRWTGPRHTRPSPRPAPPARPHRWRRSSCAPRPRAYRARRGGQYMPGARHRIGTTAAIRVVAGVPTPPRHPRIEASTLVLVPLATPPNPATMLGRTASRHLEPGETRAIRLTARAGAAGLSHGIEARGNGVDGKTVSGRASATSEYGSSRSRWTLPRRRSAVRAARWARREHDAPGQHRHWLVRRVLAELYHELGMGALGALRRIGG